MEAVSPDSKFPLWKEGPPAQGSWLVDGGEIFCADARTLLRALSDEVADLIFLDPPFNLGKSYGESGTAGDRRDKEEYEVYLLGVLEESCRVLRRGGALYLYHLPEWGIRLASFLSGKLEFRHWIAISMKGSFPIPGSLYPAHYALLFYSKGPPGFFSRPKIPAARCRSCGEYTKDYGGYQKFVEDGVNLSDVWEDLSPVRHRSRKTRAANELPVELLRRVVQISGVKNGLLVDPFVGSGTSLVAAQEVGMKFIAADREPLCCKNCVRRLK